jgi:hypothetical protein
VESTAGQFSHKGVEAWRQFSQNRVYEPPDYPQRVVCLDAIIFTPIIAHREIFGLRSYHPKHRSI